ncbi:MAG TPA: hypothetical protein V6C81_17555 [Planktothrix sp.]|jgi:hypothetical protein
MAATTMAGKRGGAKALVARSLLLAASLTFAFAGCAFAETTDASLERLEQKFFQHTYSKDTQDQRIERIEKMVFGEAKTGPDDQRLANLTKMVPENDAADDAPPPPAGSTTADSTPEQSAPSVPASPKSQAKKTASKPAATKSPSKPAENYEEADKPTAPPGTNYPAVNAIEQKVLGRQYTNDGIETRLSRLETKVFGKPSQSTDLSDRVDALKERSGIDIAARPPGGGSEWMEDDDDDITVPPSRSMPPRRSSAPPVASSSGDGQDWGRNIKNDINNFGSHGSSAIRNGAGGNWAPSPDEEDPEFDNPPPQRMASRSPSAAGSTKVAPDGMGLTQQVALLEKSVLGKTYLNDNLPTRISRLESQVFPADKTLAAKTLPDRVHKLVAIIGIAAPPAAPSRKVANRSMDDDLNDLANGYPPTAPARSNLNNLINQMSNMLNQNSFTGGYPVNGQLIPDPGNPSLLLNPVTGQLINPVNGAIVGKRVIQPMPGMQPMNTMPGAYPYNGMAPTIPSFNSGFSPMGGSTFGGMGGGVRGMTWP